MAHFLAVDWDERECRYLLISPHTGGIDISKVGSIPLSFSSTGLINEENIDDDSDDDSIPVSILERPDNHLPIIAATLKDVLKEERIESCPVLLCLGRSKVELLYQTLPPCKDSEVPVLLKNQVLRELSSYSDFDPLDYIELKGDENEQRKLLAFTIPLSFRQSLVRTFRSIGRPPKQIGFRATAAATLVFETEIEADNQESALIVNEVDRDIDLIQIVGRRILSLRSFRLPESSTPENDLLRIIDEVNRTIMIGSNEAGNQPIKKIYIFGTQEEKRSFAQLFSDEPFQIIIINPFEISGVTTSLELKKPGHFAPLLGLGFEQKTRKNIKPANSVDFLHPKEAPKPANLVRSALLAFILLLIVGYGLYHWNREVVRGMEQNLTTLQEEYKQTATQYQQIQPIWNVLRQTASWDSQNVTWLDELRALSVSLPGEQDLVVSQVSFTLGGTNSRVSGTIQISGIVRDPSVLLAFQKNLHSGKRYQMRNPDLSRNPAGGGYPWLFRTTISRLK